MKSNAQVIQDDRKANGWEYKTYRVAGKYGFEDAIGWAKGPLAVRESCNISHGHHEFWYTVDHIPTGRRVYLCEEKWEAFNFVEAASKLDGFEALSTTEGPLMPELIRGNMKKLIEQFSFDAADRTLHRHNGTAEL